MIYLIFPRSGKEAKRSVEFRHSRPKASTIIRNENVLMGKECLNTGFFPRSPSVYPTVCGNRNEAKKSNLFSYTLYCKCSWNGNRSGVESGKQVYQTLSSPFSIFWHFPANFRDIMCSVTGLNAYDLQKLIELF